MGNLVLCLFFFLFCLMSNLCYATSGSISGAVKSGGAGLAAATVTLLNGADSAWIRTEISDESGGFLLKALLPGKYYVVASAEGYAGGSQTVDVKDDAEVNCIIELQKESTSLSEVAVTAKKPFIEMGLGKLVVNIEGAVTTGTTNALELMRRLPGISVDMNGVVSMQGKSGVLVLIDGRQTYLSGEDLTEYLKTISADEVTQLELITQPGAKYDAEGNMGIINIKLKKNRREGFNGNVMLSLGSGVYFHRDESIMLDYKVKKLSLSLSATDMEAIGFADYNETLHYLNPSSKANTGSGTIHSYETERFSNTAGRFNADYKLNNRITFGANINATYHPNANQTNVQITNSDQNNIIQSYSRIFNPDGFIRNNLTTNVYYSEALSKMSNLEVNFDYLDYTKNEHEGVTNTTLDYLLNPLPGQSIIKSQQNNAINVYSLKADLTNMFKNGVNVEAGLKASWVNTDNKAVFGIFQNNVWVNDTTRSNHFLYKENIGAAYLSVSKKINPKWEAKIGLRAEYTLASGIQYVNYRSFMKNYIAPFPTAFVGYKMDSNNQFELNYGRRIERPEYKMLNPFIFYSFENTYKVGNPGLQPQYTNTAELKHSYRNMVITTFSYSVTSDEISDLQWLNTVTRVVYDKDENIASSRFAKLSVIFNKDLFKWWAVNLSGSIYYLQYSGPVNGVNQKADWNGCLLSVNTQFTFGHGWKAEAVAYYNNGQRLTQITTYDPTIYMEAGATKKIGEQFLLKFSATDPFYLYNTIKHIATDNFSSYSGTRYATRFFTLAVTYRFGGRQTDMQRNYSIDESSRIK